MRQKTTICRRYIWNVTILCYYKYGVVEQCAVGVFVTFSSNYLKRSMIGKVNHSKVVVIRTSSDALAQKMQENFYSWMICFFSCRGEFNSNLMRQMTRTAEAVLDFFLCWLFMFALLNFYKISDKYCFW